MLRRAALPPDVPSSATVAAHAAPSRAAPPAVAALRLVRFRPGASAWGLSRLVLGPRALGSPPGLRFARVLGSGRDGGFGLAPGFDRQGVIAFLDDEAAAQAFLASPAVERWRERADECFSAVLRASASRGTWAGVSLAATAAEQPGAPVASLTRASIRPHRAAAFWCHAPAAQAALQATAGCRLAVGLGEAPLLRQATFSLWDDARSLEAYARGGAHREASAGAWRQGWFSESMFVRFVPLQLEGRWQGRVHG